VQIAEESVAKMKGKMMTILPFQNNIDLCISSNQQQQ
jgi:hypothetical protein